MKQNEDKYYSFQDILKFIGFDYEFNKKNPEFPFWKGRENVEFSWGQILIPKNGIREMVKNKIADINEKPLSEINMIYSIPYRTYNNRFGAIYQNISLTFRYDKQYKYGDINKSIYEVCFFILERAIKTNDFYIITCDDVQQFMSYYIMNNQCGLGRMVIASSPSEYMKAETKIEDETSVSEEK